MVLSSRWNICIGCICCIFLAIVICRVLQYILTVVFSWNGYHIYLMNDHHGLSLSLFDEHMYNTCHRRLTVPTQESDLTLDCLQYGTPMQLRLWTQHTCNHNHVEHPSHFHQISFIVKGSETRKMVNCAKGKHIRSCQLGEE